MAKKRILWVNEPSWKATGYSVYAKEILPRLNQVDDFEVAELACYATNIDVEKHKRPWKVYANRPDPRSPEYQEYSSNPSRIFGEHKFNEVCLDFKPDIVMDIRDWWMFEYQQRCPFRDFFHWAIMPTVDATPQNPQWIDTFSSADSVFTYSEFGRDTILNQCPEIDFCGIASPCASESFFPIEDKDAHKENMGLDSNSVIVGTVMRNQRRKLYPDLFKSFRETLNKTQKNNLFLYCHKYYPDIGWETPELLDKFGLNNRVLFTYKCSNCKNLEVNFYKDSVSNCKKCGKFSQKLAGIDNSATEKELNKIYNIFDVYVQYANSEGFGMPQLEAAYAGVPIISINYSAMSSIISNTGCTGIDPIHLSMEAETGCYRAVPDNNSFIESLIHHVEDYENLRSKGIALSKIAREKYNWDKTADAWITRFKSVKQKPIQETWLSQPVVKRPSLSIPSDKKDPVDQVNYLFINVLHKPEWIGNSLWRKMVKDISFGYRVKNLDDDYYFNEDHTVKASNDQYSDFNVHMALNELVKFRNQINDWEILRGNIINAQ